VTTPPDALPKSRGATCAPPKDSLRYAILCADRDVGADPGPGPLLALGATPAPYSPPREDGLVVLLDPAGHPFCIGTRL
jgi:hypothetical protein